MTQEVNDDINATILEAEETILRIAEEWADDCRGTVGRGWETSQLRRMRLY